MTGDGPLVPQLEPLDQIVRDVIPWLDRDNTLTQYEVIEGEIYFLNLQ